MMLMAILALYVLLVVAPATAFGIVKDGSPLNRKWWES